ncbi:uncharacterized protein LOC100381567 [Zea mays]|jgi:hypothetical protein|uniref:Retrovirus-related Pol polyprotein from transposon TNT 1-94-like beta-barrel domain-containing protein n=1 Tax=Zea mays TaxID=4577 RepID=C0HH43_MAIZE|nr:uncharacterized protein LOC100381567 [Zea mays]ACN26346.1 unknown [Zea mays]|eukprot:NP_001167863.1 uncharacterized protein LOC100381567 [Zea mays]
MGWVVDSGASFHVTLDQSQLDTCATVTNGSSVQMVDGTSCSVTHKGSLCTSQFSIPDISFVPKLSMNLLSIAQITDRNCFVGFDSSSCFVQDRRSGTVIGTGHRHRDLPDSILWTLYVYLLSTLPVFHPMCPLHLLLNGIIVLATYVGLGYLL